MDFIPIGGKEIESGFVLSLYLKNDEWTRAVRRRGSARILTSSREEHIKGSYRDSTSAELNRSGGKTRKEEVPSDTAGVVRLDRSRNRLTCAR